MKGQTVTLKHFVPSADASSKMVREKQREQETDSAKRDPPYRRVHHHILSCWGADSGNSLMICPPIQTLSGFTASCHAMTGRDTIVRSAATGCVGVSAMEVDET